jgi:hypothetical protein
MVAMLTTDFLGTNTTNLLMTLTVALVTKFFMSLDCYAYANAPRVSRLWMFLDVFEMKVKYLERQSIGVTNTEKKTNQTNTLSLRSFDSFDTTLFSCQKKIILFKINRHMFRGLYQNHKAKIL